MADYKATASGNWSTMTWSPVGTPGVGDSVWANGFTVTIDIDIDLGGGTISNAVNAGIGAVNGGSFAFSTARTIVANTQAGTTQCLVANAANGFSLTGNMNAGTTVAAYGFIINGTSNGIIVGNSFANTAYGFYQNTTAGNTITLIGNSYGASLGGIFVNTGHLIIVGEVFGGTATNSYGLDFRGSNTLNITGNLYGGSGAGSYALICYTGGIVTINGNSYGGLSQSSHGIITQGVGQITLNGYAIASNICAAVRGSVGLPPIIIQGAISSSVGVSPIDGRVAFKNTNPFIQVLDEDLITIKSLTDATQVAGLLPAEEDVRAGVQYNLGGNEGTCQVPAPESVGFGVPVDDTLGEAVLNLETFLAAIAASPDPLAERIKNLATIQTVAAQLQAALTPP